MSTPEIIDDRTERNHSSALRQIGPLDTSPEKLDEATQRELVLRAIGEKYGSLDGIKRRVGFPMWFDMTELLAGMTVDYLIRRENRGDLTAYFLYADKPLRFWRIGDGRIDFEPDPDFVPRNEPAKAEELSNKQFILYPEKKKHSAADVDDDEADFRVPVGDDFFEDDEQPIGKPESPFVEKAASQNGASSEGKKKAQPVKPRSGPTAKIDISIEQLKAAMAKSKTVAGLYEILGVSHSVFYNKLNADGDLKAAFQNWKAGIAAPKNAAKKDVIEKPKRSKTEGSGRPLVDLDVRTVQRLSSEGLTVKAAAEALGVPHHSFKNYIKSGRGKGQIPKIRDAWYRGKKAAGTPMVSNKSKPAAKAVRRPVKEPIKANEPEAEETIAEIIETGKAVAEEIAKQSLSFELKFLGPDGKPIVLYELAETLGFNVGNALLHVAADEIEAASWYLDREKTRRERVAA